jgi:predicted PurR-regulated permease PerM
MTPFVAVDRVGQVIGWAMLAAFAYLVYLVIEPFLLPLGWAGVFAILGYRVHAKLARRLGLTWSAVVVTVGVAMVLVVPALLAVSAFMSEAIDAAGAIQQAAAQGRLAWFERLWRYVTPGDASAGGSDLNGIVIEAARRGSSVLVERSGLVLRDLALLPLNLAIALFATFFLLRDADTVMRAVRRLLPMQEATREALVATTAQLVTVGVTSGLAVAAVQGFLGGLVFWLVGIDTPILWGVIMGAFCLLPFGAWVAWLPAAATFIVAGDLARGVTVAVLGLVVVSGADNVLRPMLMSGRAHVHGLVMLVGLLGGVAVFGALGLVLGPILLATALALIRTFLEESTARTPQKPPLPAKFG